MIKSTAQDLLQTAETILNLMFNAGMYPNRWKTGVNIPIHKNGCPLNSENYRGITFRKRNR